MNVTSTALSFFLKGHDWKGAFSNCNCLTIVYLSVNAINNNLEQAMTIVWFYFLPDGMIFENMNNVNLKVISIHLENKHTCYSP